MSVLAALLMQLVRCYPCCTVAVCNPDLLFFFKQVTFAQTPQPCVPEEFSTTTSYYAETILDAKERMPKES